MKIRGIGKNIRPLRHIEHCLPAFAPDALPITGILRIHARISCLI